MRKMNGKILLVVAVVFFAAFNVQAYYDPSVGRFASRDPITERGGNNLYAFTANDPADKTDRLGLDTSGTPGIPHVSDDRHNNYLIFYISCPVGFKVSNVQTHYDSASMFSEMYQSYASLGGFPVDQQTYINSVQYGLALFHGSTDFGGLQGPPDFRPAINCLGQPVEEHAYMRTRLVSPGGEFELWRQVYNTPDAGTMIGIYQENTTLTWLCSSCCGRGKSN